MSLLAACFGPEQAGPADAIAGALLRAMSDDSPDRHELWHANGVALAVGRAAWQCHPDLEGETLVARGESAVVVSDASIYAVDGRSEHSDSSIGDAATLILQAYEHWGDDCARHLNGDFAFVVWDRVRRQALFCRDLVGRRGLFVRETPHWCAVASSATALARVIEPRAAVNLPLVAAAATALPGGSTETGYLGVVPVPAAATMSWSASAGLKLLTRWEPPPFHVHSAQPFEEASRQLREILTAAVERRASPARTAVWLSGGADSTAVFASAMAAAPGESASGRIIPISISYPQGDLAREDDHIRALADRWGATVRWLDSETVPLFAGIEERARLRDDPFAHTFAPVNSALAAETNAAGANVAMDGFGGDALFEVSNAYLADLLMARDVRGWLEARRASRLTNLRSTLRWGILPALPEWCWRAVDTIRGKPLDRPYRYPIVKWLSPGFRAVLLERKWDCIDLQPRRGEGPATFACRAGLTAPHFPRILAVTRAQSIPAGVEVRSPLMDPRVIEFAATRPVAERGWQGNNKRLLKAAMAGIIPDSVLAPRAAKTGIASGYLHRRFDVALLDRIRSAFGRGSAMADAALIDPGAVLEAGSAYQAHPDHLTGVSLYLTLEAEYWLRSR